MVCVLRSRGSRCTAQEVLWRESKQCPGPHSDSGEWGLEQFRHSSEQLKWLNRLIVGSKITQCQWKFFKPLYTQLYDPFPLISYILLKDGKDLGITDIPEAIAVHSYRNPYRIKEISNELCCLLFFPFYNICITAILGHLQLISFLVPIYWSCVSSGWEGILCVVLNKRFFPKFRA